MNPLVVKLWAVALILIAVFGAGWRINGNRWDAKYQKLDGEYQQFKGGVAALGQEAKTRNAVITLDNLKAKERADEEHTRQHGLDVSTIGRMRHDRDSAGGGTVPAAPAGSARPDLACFDREALKSAYGRLVERVRGGADEGTAATIDLNVAKVWAGEVHLKMSTTLKE